MTVRLHVVFGLPRFLSSSGVHVTVVVGIFPENVTDAFPSLSRASSLSVFHLGSL